MAILAFQKPEKVIMIDSDEFNGQFEFRPLEPGYGVTIGNALRRILLSSLEGFAITSIRIEGVEHEFASISGVIEDMTEIVLNFKQLRFKRLIDTEESEKITFTIENKSVFEAGDINKHLNSFQVINTDHIICTMEPSVSLNIELTIEKGRGYVAAEENRKENDLINTIYLDSIHTPIKNVQYEVEDYRVEQKTDYEKLIFNINTDGSITAKDALKEAATILIHHFMLFSDEKITLEDDEKVVTEEFDENALYIRQVLKTKLVDLDLSVRALNCLRAADIETLGDLMTYDKADLLKFRNFGKKSLAEVEALVKAKNLEFGMNVAKYKLDKE